MGNTISLHIIKTRLQFFIRLNFLLNCRVFLIFVLGRTYRTQYIIESVITGNPLSVIVKLSLAGRRRLEQSTVRQIISEHKTCL